MPFPPLSRPDRRTPAGSGQLLPTARAADEPLSAMASDMDRALGALRDFTRRDILLRFYTDRKARSVDEVARDAEIHRSVAFDHLERLVALGYLEVERRRGLPGKPAKIYRLNAGPVHISHPMRRYDVLAEALARAYAEMDEEGAAIRRVGRELGRSLGRGEAVVMPKALEPLAELGADYEMEREDRVVALNCLFAEVCRRVPLICSFHAGIIEGLTGRDGQRAKVQPLGFQGPSGCAYQVVDR